MKLRCLEIGGSHPFICWTHRNDTQYIFFDIQFMYRLQKSNVLFCTSEKKIFAHLFVHSWTYFTSFWSVILISSFHVPFCQIQDTGPPMLTCDDLTVTSHPDGNFTIVSSYNVSSVDNSGRPVISDCFPVNGSIFFLGNTTVVCHSSDPSNNTASCTFQVQVIGKFTCHFKKMTLIFIIIFNSMY